MSSIMTVLGQIDAESCRLALSHEHLFINLANQAAPGADATNDICLKCMLQEYGGRGYTHLFQDIIPMIEHQGVSSTLLHQQILHDNPLAMLTGQ